ncbi:hypothetical protein EJ05DRAFT_290163 [Pseudovirgaria hyperparasitica]|uniref:Myb-like domain-containing protein n=1 Tax=Pseudovirgaria hyperparasitica TaxID=470096 RepID=A0A6A6WEY9_9PEZI|nr:uncharacterized protein EJ05DRAFT_290163 [Pseudovirgaria hyperparasitica]KAF2760594.1 hypothetical protein EJ05DRAFT_290163 [Pseudovirgaria hyperparasitica]
MYDHEEVPSHSRKRKATADVYDRGSSTDEDAAPSPTRRSNAEFRRTLPKPDSNRRSAGTLFLENEDLELDEGLEDDENSQDGDFTTAGTSDHSSSPMPNSPQNRSINLAVREPYLEAPVHLSRAHHLKRNPPKVTPKIHYSKRSMPEHDPENHEILRLRTIEKLQWSEIARLLNADRAAAGIPGLLTDAAVYGRFVRNGPRIAALEGKELDPKDYMHIRHKKLTRQEPEKFAQWTPAHDEALVHSLFQAEDELWKRVAELLEDKTGMPFDAQDCFKRYQLI